MKRSKYSFHDFSAKHTPSATLIPMRCYTNNLVNLIHSFTFLSYFFLSLFILFVYLIISFFISFNYLSISFMFVTSSGGVCLSFCANLFLNTHVCKQNAPFLQAHDSLRTSFFGNWLFSVRSFVMVKKGKFREWLSMTIN